MEAAPCGRLFRSPIRRTSWALRRGERSPADLRLLEDLQGPKGGDGAPSASLVDTWRALQMAGHLDGDLEAEALDYARCCEHPAYSFNIAPRAVTTAVEVQVAGPEMLARWAEIKAR